MFRRVKLLGGSVDIVSRGEVLAFIAQRVAEGRKAVVGNQNLHSLELSRTNPRFHAFFDMADLIEIDSMPLVRWGRLLGLPLSTCHRSTYLDWRDDFWAMAARRRWRVFLLGATAPVNARAISRLAEEWPGVTFEGRHGHFDRRDDAAVIAEINAFRPDVLLVGMGMPLQEVWIAENYAALESGVVLPIGGAFDYEAGAQTPAPRLYGDLCLEWLFRLVHDPRRLSHRYLIEPWGLIGPALADLMRGPTPSPTRMPADTPAATDASPVLGAKGDGLAELRGPRLCFGGDEVRPAGPQTSEDDRAHAVNAERNPGDQPEQDDREEVQARQYSRHPATLTASAA